MKKKRVEKTKTTPDPRPELQAHLAALGLGSVDEYRDWCIRNGFVTSLRKHRKQRTQEISHARSRSIRKKFSRRRSESRNPLEIIVRICRADSDIEQFSHSHWKTLFQILHETQADEITGIEDFEQLCNYLGSVRAKFFNGLQVVGQLGPTTGNTFLAALTLVAAHKQHWVRPLAGWRPSSHNPRRQFAALLRHLFDRHGEVPAFFDTVWFLNRDAASARRRQWYLHVGAGHCLRKCDLPVTYTRKMARCFLAAPESVTLDQALRWGQVLGMKGDESLARALFGTRVEHYFDNEEFWSTVIAWFADHPMLDRNQVGPIIDFLHHRRFVAVPNQEDRLMTAAVQSPTGHRHQDRPLEPNLSMKGRTPGALLRQVFRWHRELSKSNVNQIQQWSPCGLKPLRFVEGSAKKGNKKTWTIRELLGARALQVEGRQLRHCVASYAQSCSRGVSSIWTLEMESKSELKKLVTIEVRNSAKAICQVRGKLNRRATEQEMQVIGRWATQTGIRIQAGL